MCIADFVAQKHSNGQDYISDKEDIANIVYEPTAKIVAEALVSSSAFRVDFSKMFTWKSGIRAPCYTNCRDLNGYPVERQVVKEALVSATKRLFEGEKVDLVVGVVTAGVTWATLLSDELRLPLAYVRNEKKCHGVGGRVECSPRHSHAIVVDDLVGSGGSLRDAINALIDESGSKVVGVLSIVNWNFSEMKDNLAGIKVYTLTSYPYILEVALVRDKIDKNEYAQLLNFYRNPNKYVWTQPN